MKQIVSNYSYSPTANCVTLTGLNIDQDQLLLIVAPGVGRTLYNFASVTGSVIAGTNTRINLTASTAGLTTTSPLVIYYDDQSAAQSVTGTVALDPASLIALENITVTVGSSVSISNLPATQTIAGTVTANVFGKDYLGIAIPIPVETNTNGISDKFIPIGFNDDGDARQVNTNSPLPIQAPNGIAISGTVTANFGDNSRMIGTIAPNGSAITGYVAIAGDDTQFGSGAGRLAVDVIGQSGTSFVDECVINNAVRAFGTVTLGTGSAQIGSVTASVINSVTVGSLPVQLSTTTIGGTSRLNVTLSSATTVGATAPSYGNLSGGSDGTNFRAILTDTSGRTVVTVSNFPSTQPVSLASLPSLSAGTAQIGSVTASISGTVPVSGTFWQATQPVSGTVTANVSGTVTAAVASTTVTVSAMPSGTLTTRFGTPTTANTAFLTSAVTNTARKYLLIQNVTTASNVITVGVGFVPTTTQGIQLAAGAGITFESSYIPTGAVWILSSVTASNHTILEA